jgi:2-polyprenyl-6-hydroxyphenyl methylase/3-demethylubiquinone-9 3-methyltransferase
MDTEVDPEQNEVRELKAAAHWTGSDVLEIGCGDGRLARRIAGLGAPVTAIDPDTQLVRSAAGQDSESSGRRIRYAVADGRQLPFSSETFDIVIFGWSL